MAKATRLKAPAAAAPQTRDQVAANIREIGDLQREFDRQRGAMNDAIAQITQTTQPTLASLSQRLETLQAGVQTWCEANRDELTGNGKSKSANLVTGEVQWRQRPPSCVIRGAEAVIANLQRLGLGRFVRTKEEINKEAILNEPEAVEGIAGIGIQSGVEDFVITPFEQDTQAA